MDQDISEVTTVSENLEAEDNESNLAPLERLQLNEPLWENGPTRAEVEEIKKKYAHSQVMATLTADGGGILWRTMTRADWKVVQAAVRNITDDAKREEVIFSKICILPDLSAEGAVDQLPAGVLPAIMQEFYLYSGFQPVSESIRL